MKENFASDVSAWQKGTFTDCCGIVVEEVRAGYTRMSCELQKWHLNGYGKAHGGLIYTLLDNAAGRAASFVEGGRKDVVTLNFNVHYLRPVSEGRIRAEGRIIKSGRTIALSCAEAFDENDKLIARADAEFFYTGDFIPHQDQP